MENKLIRATERVKSVDWHPTLPWLALGLHSGGIEVIETTTLEGPPLFHIDIGHPVRAVRFIPRQNWLVAGADDGRLHVYECTSWTRVALIEAHADYIRSLDVHPTLPFVLSAGDDKLVKTWNWDREWTNEDTFAGHEHYVMSAKFHPRDPSAVVSGSLDCSLRVWKVGTEVPTQVVLNAHEKGVDCVGFVDAGIVTGADDTSIKLWDEKTLGFIRSFDGHRGNITALSSVSSKWLVSSSEDKTVRIWSLETGKAVARLEEESLGRAWTLTSRSTNVAVGFDCGFILIDVQTSALEQAPSISHL
ncbi:unnamed protein product [Aphanomyces euteiches]|uniref:WD repeat-containing protein 54 beta-propeller domain-containing protein n=1 Tax=Aphanomyces euteiches TaxID=100861 RepID=A0A6G0WHM4_9STRA|nr:hypothetical protein Ae201684_015087 [Aphanomyces euteiches]KAH9062959.1 hypothetical protein Ae201684P_009224 [Aphanomyces euteiches]KAH9133683.1 hypothetical protein AeRB84_020276 [Aphanomyces euteiches]